jgi:hypothetical protein
MKDYTGQTINGFYIIEEVGKRSTNKLYKIRCLCGKVRFNKIYEIMKTITCRCNDFKSSEEICLDQLYQRYKYGSKHRRPRRNILKSIEFNLNKETFVNLVKSNCYYCNKEPSNLITVNKKHKLKYSGIDRLDNNIGYFDYNCVSCCWKCNQMKSKMNFEEFKNIINQIFSNLKEKI